MFDVECVKVQLLNRSRKTILKACRVHPVAE
jgi:hypothetical protein